MNKLQKDHKKALKRDVKRAKHKKYDSIKVGRAKVQRKQQDQHRRLLIAEMLKEKPSTTSGMIWKHTDRGTYGYEPDSL